MSSNYPVISELLFVKKVCLFHCVCVCVCVCVCDTKCPSEFKQEVVNCINKNSLCNALLFNKRWSWAIKLFSSDSVWACQCCQPCVIVASRGMQNPFAPTCGSFPVVVLKSQGRCRRTKSGPVVDNVSSPSGP